MQPSDKTDQLQMAANFMVIRKILRWRGVVSVVWGAIGVAGGVYAIHGHPLNAILVLLATALTVEGIWVLAAPRPAGIIADGGAQVVVGVWNILVFALVPYAFIGVGGLSMPAPPALGPLQVLWGILTLVRYRFFSRLAVAEPSKDELRQIKALVKDIVYADPRKASDVVEFEAGTLTRKAKDWKGRLAGETATFVEGWGSDIVFAKKSDVNFVNEGTILFGRRVEALFQMRDRSVKGSITPELLKRYESWKSTER